MMLKELTQRQSEVVSLIRRHIDEQGYPPSTQELARSLGVSTTAADQHVTALERKGVLRRTPRIARGIKLTPAGDEV